ncbi:major facilitator superfamily domain-containing protein [Microdochium trichocladiopsis]|uniref:Major facilitator superfamily domain-containing protein n=1 Tax=Microdochium trichocladiopsis TaxID=1682393 RepID=A0A9P9BTE4_9PEZI|nr:major facilitator superfamily domain-containing protein [Microdochium trichocladiopsis]KAH7039896.1 major facilitator superfamily domain-containing protein [Microdochium trichocladiopsis]
MPSGNDDQHDVESQQHQQQHSDSGSETAHAPHEDEVPEKQPEPEDQLRTSPKGPGEDSNNAQDPNLVTWDGPDDPENPLNWSSSKRWTTVAVVSYLTFLAPLSSTVPAPTVPYIIKDFAVADPKTEGTLVTTIYILAYVFGPLLIAPLSELYGRLPLYHACNTLYLVFSIACAVAGNMSSLIAFRFLAGLASSCPLTIGAGSIADIVPLRRRGLAMTFWVMGPLVGPTIGPLAGGYLAESRGWRWVFWLISILAALGWILGFIFLRESYATVILKRKAARLRKETGNMDLVSALDTGRSPRQLFAFSIVRPLKMLLFQPIVLMTSANMAMIYGYLYLLFTTFPRVFGGQYGFSTGSVGLAYLGVGLGSFLGLILTGAFSDRTVAALTKRNGGVHKAEFRLPPMFVGAFLVPAGLFVYGWTAEAHAHWILPIIGSAILGFGMMTIFTPSTTYIIDAFTVYAASGTAAATVLRSILGAVLPLAGEPMYDALGLGWGTSVLAFIAVAFTPVPFVFWIYGERIRKSERFRMDL